jgi:hypothetical protein
MNAGLTGRTTVPFVNVRSSRDIYGGRHYSGNIVKVLNDCGTSVEILDHALGWVKVRHDGKAGWCLAAYIEEV